MRLLTDKELPNLVTEVFLKGVNPMIAEHQDIFFDDKYFTGYYKNSPEYDSEHNTIDVVRPIYDYREFDILFIISISVYLQENYGNVYEKNFQKKVFNYIQNIIRNEHVLRLSIENKESTCVDDKYYILFAYIPFNLISATTFCFDKLL